MSVEPKSPNPAAESEPTASLATVPMWLIALMLVLLLGGAVYFDARGGWFDARVYKPFAALPEQFQPPPPDGPDLRPGRRIYDAACAACHMVNGVGNPAVNAPPIAGSDWVLADGPNRLIRIVLDGLAGPIEVSGKQYGGGVMTPFKGTFSDEEIAQVLTYIRRNPDWKHDASEVTAEQVAKIRELSKDRAVNWTSAELLTIPVKD
jgi:mono/diheme cytochrome c family protein